MKAVLAIAFVAAAIAAPFAIPALGIAAAGSFAAIAVTAAVEVGLALLQTAVLGPANAGRLTQTTTSRLQASLVTTEPRKILFGITAAASDVRYL
jgi:hypothetical protein